MNDNIREQIYLAALLHDIGKFYQRADKSFSDKFNSLSEYSKRIAEMICPLNSSGTFGYQHVVWTNEFLTEKMDIFHKIPNFKQNNYNNTNAEESFTSFACNHHRPKTEMQALITLADWWSAGIDRTNPESMEKEECQSGNTINWGRQRYKQIPLYSVFNKVNKGNFSMAFKLEPLTIEEGGCFPTNIESTKDGVSQEKYSGLWQNFIKEFDKLPADSFHGFSESLLYLLKKFTWCIPSNTMDMADVSLYEHLKTTAAIADCLYLYKQENPDMLVWNANSNRLHLNDEAKPILLLGGDISGIQKFIYNITSKNAAVSLKGRSFYLQLLVDSVIQKIITHQDIDCTVGQVVYSSGGKFYMMLPNTAKVRNAISQLKKQLESSLWKDHYGQLVLNLEYVAFSYDNIGKYIRYDGCEEQSKMGDLWKCLADKLYSCKAKKFKTLLSENFEQMFAPIKVSTEDNVCALTGIEGKCESYDGGGENSIMVLETVKKQIDLGKTLKDADYIITYRANSNNNFLSNRAKRNSNISICDVYNYLFDSKELTDDSADFRNITSVDVSRVKMINMTNFLAAPIKGLKVSYGFQFYGGNKQAQNSNGDNKTFEELSGGTYLGILRMDVDNLGKIFIEGLPNESRSFAAYSTLSFLLDYFFSGYLNAIRDKDDFKDDVNILYSGGDDVFAIGKWDKIILFANAVRTEFERFVGRDDITISAGVTIVKDKYPIAKAAQLAGDAEEMAKQFGRDKLGTPIKNAINLFGESVSWRDEFEYVKEYKDKFTSNIRDNNMPKSILHRLVELHELKQKGDYSYAWNLAYYLARFMDGGYRNFCLELQKELTDNRKFTLIVVAARWAELENKINKN